MISAQCKVLGIARSSYYASSRKKLTCKASLEADIARLFFRSKKAYGARRIKDDLSDEGKIVSRRRVTRIINKLDLVSTHCKSVYKRPKEQTAESSCPDLLEQNFSSEAPRYAFVGDLTYVRVGARWAYVCVLLDLYNREIVGYATGPNKDAKLLQRAFASFKGDLREVSIYHLDRGSENVNQTIDRLLAAFGIKSSLSRKGNSHDNAVAESVIKTLKKEFVYQESFATLQDLQVKIAGYIWWYNNERKHSSLGYVAPRQYA